MELVEYQPWHYEYLVGTTTQGILMGSEIIQMFGAAYYIKGDTFSAKHNNKLIGCAGIIEMWPGVAEAWAALTDDIRMCPFFLHRKTYRIMKELINRNKYHRLQANISLDNATAIKWIERLGFSYESTMKRFGADGSDHAMYVWGT
jgi:hypothetical protein